MNILDIIISPLITEKSMNDAALGKYSFKVTRQADKLAIKRAIEEKFKVNVVKVSTITIKGRSVRGGVRRSEIFKQPFKKAIVTVKKGEKISIFDTAGQTEKNS